MHIGSINTLEDNSPLFFGTQILVFNIIRTLLRRSLINFHRILPSPKFFCRTMEHCFLEEEGVR
jgi:hypothetical protein